MLLPRIAKLPSRICCNRVIYCARNLKKQNSSKMSSARFHTSRAPSANKKELSELLSQATKVVFLTGAGISAESGIPTFRGAGGLWRTFSAPDLATPTAFRANPSLVWEFYSHRREVVLSKKPNPAHYAIAEYQKRMLEEGKEVWVITQNIDELHKTAGAQDVIELHGTLFKTRCVNCGHVAVNKESPIVPALKDKGAPDSNAPDARIPESELPRRDETLTHEEKEDRPAKEKKPSTL